MTERQFAYVYVLSRKIAEKQHNLCNPEFPMQFVLRTDIALSHLYEKCFNERKDEGEILKTSSADTFTFINFLKNYDQFANNKG
jgi:hypothetical protein